LPEHGVSLRLFTRRAVRALEPGDLSPAPHVMLVAAMLAKFAIAAITGDEPRRSRCRPEISA
jgi:hypothetical protein